jgi:hypothetical protein
MFVDRFSAVTMISTREESGSERAAGAPVATLWL